MRFSAAPPATGISRLTRRSPSGLLQRYSKVDRLTPFAVFAVARPGAAARNAAAAVPPSACFNTKAICASVNFDAFMEFYSPHPRDQSAATRQRIPAMLLNKIG